MGPCTPCCGLCRGACGWGGMWGGLRGGIGVWGLHAGYMASVTHAPHTPPCTSHTPPSTSRTSGTPPCTSQQQKHTHSISPLCRVFSNTPPNCAQVVVDLATLHILDQPHPTPPSNPTPTPTPTPFVSCTALAHAAVVHRCDRQCVCMPQQPRGAGVGDGGSSGGGATSGGVLRSEDIWTAALLRMLHGALRYAYWCTFVVLSGTCV